MKEKDQIKYLVWKEPKLKPEYKNYQINMMQILKGCLTDMV